MGDPLLKRISLGTADWFKLHSASPAIGRAHPLVEVTVDFFGTPRDSAPDIGSHELFDIALQPPTSTCKLTANRHRQPEPDPYDRRGGREMRIASDFSCKLITVR